MINILFTDDSLPVGGKEILLLYYLKKLERNKFEVHFVTLTSKGILISEAAKYSDNYACMRRKARLDLSAIWRLRCYLKKNKIRIIHTNLWIDSLYVYIASMGLKVKKVSTVHGYSDGWRRRVHKSVLKKFDQVVCVSNSSRRCLIHLGFSPQNMTVIYNGVDISRFQKPRPKKQRGRFFVIGLTGSFRKERDQLTLCKALNFLLKKGNNNIIVHYVGGAIDKAFEMEVKRYCSKNGLQDHVRFLGLRHNIVQQLQLMDIYVASSHSETFGLGLVEAMACGLPVIVSDIPPFMEIIGNGEYGLFFQTCNYEELAQRIMDLMENDYLRSHYGELAHTRGRTFSIESSVRKMEELYQELYDL